MFSRRKTAERNSLGQQLQGPAFGGLLDRARHNEPEALSVLYHKFLPGVFAYIVSRVPDRFTAEDLTSEVFLSMVEGIKQVKANDEAHFAAWLLQIARITVAGYYRKREKHPSLVPLEPSSWENNDENAMIPASHPDTDPVRWSEARAEWHVVAQAINALTEEQRQVLVGRLILGYDVATVAKMVGKKANAVKALQFRALHSLQRLLAQSALSAELSHSYVEHQEEVL